MCTVLGDSCWCNGGPQSSRVHSVIVFFTGIGKTGTGGACGFESGGVVGRGGIQWLSSRKISLLMGNMVYLSREECGTWTTPVSGALQQLSQPSTSAQLQGKKQFCYTSCPHITVHSAVWRHYINVWVLLYFFVDLHTQHCFYPCPHSHFRSTAHRAVGSAKTLK